MSQNGQARGRGRGGKGPNPKDRLSHTQTGRQTGQNPAKVRAATGKEKSVVKDLLLETIRRSRIVKDLLFEPTSRSFLPI